ncbi:Neutral protease 2-like protein [Lasiodiplodia theobromae]|uniref:Neutral protease 2 n=1 Tax=Lasiodiplodia theobromae TaxID=45133 RepID=A0A5N5D514_9PEZI|nr:Neutral protease 2-like protein [Lasiodiplodia theobromae]
MKFIVGLSFLASLAAAASVDVNKRETPLEVKLELLGNTGVKASITNTGSSALKLFKTGTLLDQQPVEKVEIHAADKQVSFDGIRYQVSTQGLTEEAFQSIAAGETIEVEFDAAETHDLSEGGAVELLSQGAFSFAESDSTTIAGVVPFISNVVSTSVDGAAAKRVHDSFHEKVKRTVVQSSCTGSQGTATRNAISACRSLAQRAQTAASSGSASKFQEYFKSTSSSTRSTVAAVFGRIVSECGSTTSGSSRYYCNDVLGACSNGVLAYTQPATSIMVNCPLFFSALSPTSSACHAQDQQTTILHEMTHLTQIKGTSDYGGYGYNFVQSLSAAQNLNHADTYTLYAQALYAGC